MADYTSWGIPAPEWTHLEETYPQWFQPPPKEWSIQKLKEITNERRAKRAAVEAASFDNVKTETLSIPTRDGSSIDVRLYMPRDNDTADGGTSLRPIYIHLHGGGFMFGSLDTDHALCCRFASSLKILVLSVNYRHTPGFVYPTQVHDVWDALGWAFDNLPRYGGDTDRVALGGTSAGANLTAAMGVMELDHNQRRIKGVLLAAPLTGPQEQDFPSGILSANATPSYEQNANAPVLSRARVDLFYDHYKALPNNDRYFNVMKLTDTQIRTFSFRRAYFMICGLDPFRDEGIVWRERLARNGIETKMIGYPGFPHGLGLGYVQENDGFEMKNKWDGDYVAGVRWLLDLP